jgi:hypothetical protein
MRKLLFVVAVALVALAVSVPALATGTAVHRQGVVIVENRSVFDAVGPVLRVFPTAGALKMHVHLGSIGVRGHIGHTLALHVASTATVLYVDDGIAKPVSLKDVKRGQRVDVEGTVDRSVRRARLFEATKIIVRDPTPAAQLTEYACGGPVTSVSTAPAAPTVTLTLRSASRALWGQIGQSFTEVVKPDTRVYKWIGGVKTTITLDQVKAGDVVWTKGTIDRTVLSAPVFNADVLTVRVSLP